MIFKELPLKDSYLIDIDRKKDARGWFARYFCQQEYAKMGLESNFVQSNFSFNNCKNTLRGLHFQRPPKSEIKVVTCVKGAVWDVIADLRSDSPSYGKWYGTELSEANKSALYIPKGFAHGFITLENNSELFYLHSEFYSSGCEGAVRYDDPQLNILWPSDPVEISDRDVSADSFDSIGEIFSEV